MINSPVNNITENTNRLHLISMFSDLVLQYYKECNFANVLDCNDSRIYINSLDENEIRYRRYNWNNNIQIVTKELLKNLILLDNSYCNNSSKPTNEFRNETCLYIRYDILFKSRHIKISEKNLDSFSMRKLLHDIKLFSKFIYDLVTDYLKCNPDVPVFSCKNNIQQQEMYEWSETIYNNSIINNLSIIRSNLLRTVHSFECDNLCQ